MKKILFVILVCIVAAASYAAKPASRPGLELGKPSARPGLEAMIQIVTKDIDIGEVDKGKMFDYKIEVKNTGKEDLIIENVYSSCGCLEVTDKRWPNMPGNVAAASYAAPLAKLAAQGAAATVIIKPNHSIYIDVRLDTNKVSGEFEKILHVISNDPDTKDAMWKIKGVVPASRPGLELGKPSARPGLEVAADAAGQIVMVFYSHGCNECKEIMEGYLPKIKEKYRDKIAIVSYNIDNPESFAFLLDLQNKYDERLKKGGFFNPKPPTIFANNKLLYGVKEIKERLEDEIKK